MLAYIIKMLLCSGIMYLYYLLFLRDKKFHRYNRFYLLAIVVLSFLIPLISFDIFVQSDNAHINKLLEVLYVQQPADTVMIITGKATKEIPWEIIGYISTAVISVSMLVLVIIRIMKVLGLKRKYHSEKITDITFINTQLQEAPFSFFKNLFWRTDIQLNDETGQQIMRHEMAHIRQNHSWDRIFLQVVKAVCWFNPIFYLIEKEIILIHEYIADEEAIENKDGRAFAAMLLRSSIESFGYAPGQAIFYSSIKKRLHMLTNKQKTKYSYASRLLVLPLLGCITFAVGLNIQKAEAKETIKKLETQIAATQVNIKDTFPPLKGKVDGLMVMTESEVKVLENGKPVATVDRDDPLSITFNDDSTKKPLMIIDGKALPANANINNYINKSDIEAIRVLKDESEIKKYGDKGKYGVVEIVSKKNANKNDAQSLIVTGKKNQDAMNVEDKKKFVKGNIDILYILDGTPIEHSKIESIHPNDIEAISVLKDSIATSLYGEKGKNGVILINTKQDIRVKQNKDGENSP